LDPTPIETPTIVAGGGSHTTDIQGLLEFFSRAAEDERFNADNILYEIDLTYRLSMVERAMYKYLLIPVVRDIFREQGRSWAWTEHRPRWGPGRDVPMNLAGDTTSYRSVIIDSALGLQPPQEGGLPTSSPITPFFRQRVAEIEQWILNTPAPEYPLEYDDALATAGSLLFEEHCAVCHESGRQNRMGTVIPLEEIQTDPSRTQAWTREAADLANELVANELGMARSPMSKPYDGYVALQLDGLWLRAPYLHNGSVPTVRALLEKPECRPLSFYRGYDLLDQQNMGFVALRCDEFGEPVLDLPPGCPAKHVTTGCVPELKGWWHDTREAGNSASGALVGH